MTDSHGDAMPEERARRAGLWEAGADERERLADERERLADERERLADEREALADERERLADRQERTHDERETSRAVRVPETADADDAAEEAATQAAVRRAEAAVRRAEAELERTRQAATRVRARAALRGARSERVATAEHAAQTVDAEESTWLADRRDFVAADRDRQADERDDIADRREETAGFRERLADERERELLDRERQFDQLRPTGRRSAARLRADREQADAEAHADGERRRERAAAGRRGAAHDRARAAQVWGPQAYGPMLLAAFTPLARQLLGNLQFATGIGPGPEAMDSENPVYEPDLVAAPRWPVLAATADELGVSSALCYGLFVQRPAQWSALGALTLYSVTPDAFSDDDQEFGSILAAYVGIAVSIAQRHDEVDRREAALHRGLSSRDIIGQAKGILMERQRLSAGDAFDLLRRVSQRLNRKLADVAQQLAETGELPS